MARADLTTLASTPDGDTAWGAAMRGAMSTLATDVTTLDGAVADVTALEAADVALDGRLDTAEAELVALDGRIDTLEATDLSHGGRLTTAEGDITALETTVGGHTTDLTALDGRLDTLEAQTLDARLTTAEGDITALETSVATKVTGSGVTTLWSGTQAAYDAIVTKDANTIYAIV